MFKKQKDTYIDVLKCIHSHPEGISARQIESELKIDRGSLKWLDREADTGGQKVWRINRNEHNDWMLILSLEGRAIILEHEELKGARRSSLIATILATLALTVAIVIGWIQIITPVKISNDQILAIKATWQSKL